MGFFSQLFASAMGGAIAGYFVVVGVKLQFRRQSEAALRALMVEVTGNKEAALGMTSRSATPGTPGFALGEPDPSWLKHSIWDSQLPYAVQLFDEGALVIVRHAYSLLEAISAMENKNATMGSPRFHRGGWIDDWVTKLQTAFSDADQALLNLRMRLDQEADKAWYNRLLKFACELGGKVIRK